MVSGQFQGYDTPEQAAMEGFPPRYVRVVSSRAHGDEAFVLLDTGTADSPYSYGCNCRRVEGRWVETSSSNMPGGWQQCSEQPELGTLTLWGEAPAGAVGVRLTLDGKVIEEPIANGVYLVARFNVPPPTSWPSAEFIFE